MERFMRMKLILIGILFFQIMGMFSSAYAWGPRAKQAITAMAIQMIQSEFPYTFRPSGSAGVGYEKEAIQGSADGWQTIAEFYSFENEEAIFSAITSEIQLLRDIRRFGPSSYYAYRLGVLSALVADLMIPYGFAWTDEERQLQKVVNEDIDKQLDSYAYQAQQTQRNFIIDVKKYFSERRPYFVENKRLIANDYRLGKGYNGLLAKAGLDYFVRTVRAVSDVWYTVLRPEDEGVWVSPPSDRTRAWYFVKEIEFLLDVKKNMFQADKVYENFTKLSLTPPEAVNRIGDAFYRMNSSEAKNRAVQLWRSAYTVSAGELRNTIAKKLSKYYYDQGQTSLARANQPGGKEEDLNNALYSFQQAIEFDRENQEIVNMIQQTYQEIKERTEYRNMLVTIISQAEKTQEEAEKYRLSGDYGNAILTYRIAVSLYNSVDDRFKDLESNAKGGLRRVKKSISDVINEVLDRASDAIDQGDQHKESNRFEEAISAYSKVESIVSVIPDDENPTLTQQKQNVIELSKKRIEEAKIAKVRYEQAMQEAQQRAAQQGGGGGGGAPRLVPPPAAPPGGIRPVAPPAQQ
ncbi:MAG TPA: hypothetical protein PLT82_03085 [Candidatus Hydrogenedens sp.]|nr:hypothetical protein [Candidatus Hydrogenedens sp.]HOL19085.1 hypothetical protein [Candidatus Hydrogenedens sp.]HPP58097.1 hypothetical protein [Candidatus Hydrogenedens sp.]